MWIGALAIVLLLPAPSAGFSAAVPKRSATVTAPRLAVVLTARDVIVKEAPNTAFHESPFQVPDSYLERPSRVAWALIPMAFVSISRRVKFSTFGAALASVHLSPRMGGALLALCASVLIGFMRLRSR